MCEWFHSPIYCDLRVIMVDPSFGVEPNRMCCETDKLKMKVAKKRKKTINQSPQQLKDDIVDDIDSPIRSIACLKKIDDMQRFEETEDCFILGFDPSADVPLSFDSSATPPHADDISVIAEKGKVACRDYPHSRHLCMKFPFKTTPHESYCGMCYCYVCDSAAPCKDWTGWHCNAENNGFWKNKRNKKKPPV